MGIIKNAPIERQLQANAESEVREVKRDRFHKKEKPDRAFVNEEILSWIALGVSALGVAANIYLTFFR